MHTILESSGTDTPWRSICRHNIRYSEFLVEIQHPTRNSSYKRAIAIWHMANSFWLAWNLQGIHPNSSSQQN
jgi:hypothetical protein